MMNFPRGVIVIAITLFLVPSSQILLSNTDENYAATHSNRVYPRDGREGSYYPHENEFFATLVNSSDASEKKTPQTFPSNNRTAFGLPGFIPSDPGGIARNSSGGDPDATEAGYQATVPPQLQHPVAKDAFLDTRVWKQIQVVTSFVGFALNLLAFGVFVLHGNFFTKTLRILLSHQCFLDFSLCLMGGILLLQKPMWTVGWMPIDGTLCYTWHSQQLFWAFVFMSIHNLVVISYERYVAVCRATSDFKFQGRIVKLTLLAVYASGAVMSFPMAIHNRWHSNACLNEIYFDSEFMKTYFVFIYSCIWLYMAWVLPCLAFIVNYGRVVKLLIERNRSKTLARSEVVGVVQKRITKMAILLTLVVFFCIGFDAIAFINGNSNFKKMKVEQSSYVGSPIQMTGLALCLVNSVVNPVVYWIYMPKFRKATIKTLLSSVPCAKGVLGSTEMTENSVSITGSTTATTGLAKTLPTSHQMETQSEVDA